MFNRKLASLAVVATVSPFLFACTSQDLYEATQENRLQECRKLYGAQQEECEAQYQKAMTPTNEKETKSLMRVLTRVSRSNVSIAIQRLSTALLKRVVPSSYEQLE